ALVFFLNIIMFIVFMQEFIILLKRVSFDGRFFLKVHNCCAVSFIISYNIHQAIYLSFKGGILS
ncbi:MAG: hypothetical protein RR047_03690, partial [Bacilli bacterium]